ncbi:MAG: cytochrome b562, partial [Thalassotalea sp.]|nr:cytochrome b562 [Thalassotalea sp.]
LARFIGGFNVRRCIFYSFAPQGSAELKTYKTEVDKMIEGIDTMIAQANAGELTKGSDALKQLKTLKEDGHKALDMKD